MFDSGQQFVVGSLQRISVAHFAKNEKSPNLSIEASFCQLSTDNG
jgi:hypothetical protein